MKTLFAPLRYFWLINAEKSAIDFWPTLGIVAILVAAYMLLPQAPFFGADGFLDGILTIVSALTGFFVAALIAAATFQHVDLDTPITKGAVYVRRKNSEGAWENYALSRRELACTIFGYLSFLGLFLSLAIAMGMPLSRSFAGYLGPEIRYWARAIGILVFAVPVAHLFVASALGIYYLSDRLHRNEPKVTGLKDGVKRAA
jgi:hypothetical protein